MLSAPSVVVAEVRHRNGGILGGGSRHKVIVSLASRPKSHTEKVVLVLVSSMKSLLDSPSKALSSNLEAVERVSFPEPPKIEPPV